MVAVITNVPTPTPTHLRAHTALVVVLHTCSSHQFINE